MRDIHTESKEKNIVVGFAVDVSGSMQQSIRNENRKDVNRFESFKDALRKLSRETKKEIYNYRRDGYEASINVFAYVFGLRIFPNCDFLSLINFRKENEKKSNMNSSRNIDPYRELENIAQQNGIEDMPGFGRWIQDVLDYREANNLVIILNRYPSIAKHIVRLLPKNFGQAMIAGARNATARIMKYTPLSFCSDLVENKELTKANALAKELANASSDGSIIKIIIREIGEERFGQNIKEELTKYGEMLMPLEELANLLETQEKELSNIESLIYGDTPMKGTLDEIIERFGKELKKMPLYTVSFRQA